MRVDFGPHMQRMHTNLRQDILCLGDMRRTRLVRRHQLDQWQQVDWIERMGDHDLFGARRAILKLRRFESAG